MIAHDVFPPDSPYLVIPRTLAEKMDLEWQLDFTQLLREFYARTDELPPTEVAGYIVQAFDANGLLIPDPITRR